MLRLGMLLLSLMLPTWLCAAESALETVPPWEINQAKFLVNDEMTPPQLSENQWQDVLLPHRWSHDLGGPIGVGWYRLHLSVDSSDHHLWVIYLPKLSMNASIWLNGNMIGKSGHFEEPISRNWNRPLLFSIPAPLLKQGDNVVEIRVKAYADNGGGLAPVYIGPEEVLSATYEWRTLLLNSIPTITFFMIIWLALMAALLWFMRRQDSMYGWFALACLWACLYLSNHFIRDIPVSRDLWEWCFHLSMDAFAGSIVVFVHRWIGLQRRWLEYLMWGWIVSAYLLLLVLGDYKIAHMNFIHIGAIIGGCYVVWLMACCWWQRREKVFLFILATYAINVSCGVHDWYVVLNKTAYENAYLMPYAVPLQLIVIAVYLMLRFARLQQRAERFTFELQEKVEETTEHLNAEYDMVRQLEKKQAICDERERMMQDLHDGLGGQLVSALAQVNNHQTCEANLKQTLSDALLDLRLVIDSLDEDNCDLSTMLGMLRMRLEPQLKASGIKLNWMLNDDSDLDDFGHETALHLLRIVQEAITNAIRHAQCTEINMVIESLDGRVAIRVEDNGIGMSHAKPGRGTGNMRRRAKKIGAELMVESSTSGVKVQIVF